MHKNGLVAVVFFRKVGTPYLPPINAQLLGKDKLGLYQFANTDLRRELIDSVSSTEAVWFVLISSIPQPSKENRKINFKKMEEANGSSHRLEASDIFSKCAWLLICWFVFMISGFSPFTIAILFV